MNTAILNVACGEAISDANTCDSIGVAYELCKRGFFVRTSVTVCVQSDIAASFDRLLKANDLVVICGNADVFYQAMSGKYVLSDKPKLFSVGDKLCAVVENATADYIGRELVPMLNGKRSTSYDTSVFCTFGVTEEKLRELLKNQIKNRNKIVFKFVSNPPECKVLVRYSNKMRKDTVNALLSEVAKILKDCTYSYDDSVSLAEKVASLLIEKKKTLGVAESFTGGNIAASLVGVPGISSSLKEGLVCYSNDAKIKHLRVPKHVIDNFGAVSDETAYEMAANLLADGKHDYVLATTGNAGPTSEKPNEVGLCYIAVGTADAVDVYKCNFTGTRNEVINEGTKTALYYLYKALSGK